MDRSRACSLLLRKVATKYTRDALTMGKRDRVGELAIQNGRASGQGPCDGGDRREPVGEVVATLAKEFDVAAVLVELDAVAVEFDLVHPAIARWWSLASARRGGCDEANRRLHWCRLSPTHG